MKKKSEIVQCDRKGVNVISLHSPKKKILMLNSLFTLIEICISVGKSLCTKLFILHFTCKKILLIMHSYNLLAIATSDVHVNLFLMFCVSGMYRRQHRHGEVPGGTWGRDRRLRQRGMDTTACCCFLWCPRCCQVCYNSLKMSCICCMSCGFSNI